MRRGTPIGPRWPIRFPCLFPKIFLQRMVTMFISFALATTTRVVMFEHREKGPSETSGEPVARRRRVHR